MHFKAPCLPFPSNLPCIVTWSKKRYLCVALEILHRWWGNPIPSVLGFAMEILMTLQAMVENVDPEKAFLPWLGNQLSPGPTAFSKAYSVASNILFWRRVKSLDNLAQVFPSHSQGDIKSTEDLFARKSPLIFTEWFPKHSSLAFGHLLRLLERGPAYHQRVILLMLKVLQQTRVDAAQSPHVYAIVSQLVESTLCWETLSVLEALLQSCSVSSRAQMDELGFGDTNGFGMEKALQGMLALQNSFKARSGPLQYMAGGQGGGGGAGGNYGRL